MVEAAPIGGPLEIPFIGSVLGMLRDPLDFLTQLSKQYGDIARFHMLNREVILLGHPDQIEELLITHKDRTRKDWLTRELDVVVGKGLLISEGNLWKTQRRLVQPGFHRDRIAAYADVMVRYTERAIEGWKDGETRDVHVDLMRLTLDIVAKTLFGVEVGAVARQIEEALEILMERYAGIESILPIEWPLPRNRRARKAMKTLDDIIYGIIRERQQTEDTGDLISMLIAASEKMEERQLRDEVITLLLAGHETTALALGYALYLLGQNAPELAKLRAEITSVLGDRPATAADVPNLRYADGAIKEAMRLFPPAWAIGREATEDFVLAGHPIEKGMQLWAAEWVVHRDRRWFPEPEKFKPERWEPAAAASIPKHAYFPFGGGSRVCIGNAFATMEMILCLVTIVRRFDVTFTGGELKLIPSITIRPKGGLPMRLRRLSDGRNDR